MRHGLWKARETLSRRPVPAGHRGRVRLSAFVHLTWLGLCRPPPGGAGRLGGVSRTHSGKMGLAPLRGRSCGVSRVSGVLARAPGFRTRDLPILAVARNTTQVNSLGPSRCTFSLYCRSFIVDPDGDPGGRTRYTNVRLLAVLFLAHAQQWSDCRKCRSH